jgi:capsular polysaccharide biosynthesis protein
MTPRTEAVLIQTLSSGDPEVIVIPAQAGVLLEEGRYWPPLRIFELKDVKLDVYSGLAFSDGWVVIQSGYGHRWPCDAAFITGATRRVRDLPSRIEQRKVAMLGDVVHHYHFLIETLPRILRLKKACPDITFLTVQEPMELARDLMSFIDAQFEVVDEEMVVEGGSIWVHEPFPRDWLHPADHQLLCETFVAKAQDLVPASNSRVYISRSHAARALLYESNLEAWLLDHGFMIVHLEDLPFLEQVGLMSHAEFVIAPHGAGLANIVFMPPGGKVIELSSGEWICPAFRRIAAQSGHDYLLLELKGTPEAPWGDAESAINVLSPILGAVSK